MNGFSKVMELADSENRYYDIPSDDHIEGQGKGDWLKILAACVEAHDEFDDGFAGAWVND